MTDGPAGACRRAFAWALVVAWAAFLYSLSSVSTSTGSIGFEGSDKLIHGLLYTVLGALLARALRTSGPHMPAARVVTTSLVLGTLYGLGDEWHQGFVPERSQEWGDIVADAVGSLAGAILWLTVAGWFSASRSGGSPN